MVLAGILLCTGGGGEAVSLFGIGFLSPVSLSPGSTGQFVSESKVSRGSLSKADIDGQVTSK